LASEGKTPIARYETNFAQPKGNAKMRLRVPTRSENSAVRKPTSSTTRWGDWVHGRRITANAAGVKETLK
jgi:hypothetical protein